MNAGVVYSSDLAVQALKLPLDGAPWPKADTRCACCGKPILKGDLAVRDKDRFGQSFTDGPFLAARGSGAVCGACSAIMNAKPLMALQHAVITADGAYSIRKDIHRAWFLLTPPAPPYVAVVSDTKQAHLIWKTPPTLDNNLMIVRLGQRLLRIRRPVLMQALHDCQLAADALNALATEKTRGRPAEGLRHPFVYLGRELDDPRHGLIRSDLERAPAAAPGTPVGQALQRLRQLTIGELWALATLAKRKVEEPTQPDPIDLNAQSSTESTDDVTP